LSLACATLRAFPSLDTASRFNYRKITMSLPGFLTELVDYVDFDKQSLWSMLIDDRSQVAVS
jgi:hypothetical protein